MLKKVAGVIYIKRRHKIITKIHEIQADMYILGKNLIFLNDDINVLACTNRYCYYFVKITSCYNGLMAPGFLVFKQPYQTFYVAKTLFNKILKQDYNYDRELFF